MGSLRRTAAVLLVFGLVSACQGSKSTIDMNDSIGFEPYYTVNDSLSGDRTMELLLTPYRRVYDREMGRTLAYAPAPLRYDQPESPLGNLVSDMIRYRASHEMERFVHLAVITPELFGVEFDEGEITMADLYHFMPLDVTLVILKADGTVVRELAQEIAKLGGIPVSGMRMVIDEHGASGILVDAEALADENSYYIATVSTMIYDRRFSSLQKHTLRVDRPVLIRQLVQDYFRGNGVVESVEDLRIRTRCLEHC